MKTRTSRPFTLLEVAAVIGILLLIGGLIGVRGKKLLDHHSFKAATGKISSKVVLARTLAENYQTDVTLRLQRTPKGLFLTLLSDEPPLQKLPQFKTPLAISGIDAFTFDGEETPSLDILFSGSGGIFPEGHLALISGKRNLQLPIGLAFPSQMP